MVAGSAVYDSITAQERADQSPGQTGDGEKQQGMGIAQIVELLDASGKDNSTGEMPTITEAKESEYGLPEGFNIPATGCANNCMMHHTPSESNIAPSPVSIGEMVSDFLYAKPSKERVPEFDEVEDAIAAAHSSVVQLYDMVGSKDYSPIKLKSVYDTYLSASLVANEMTTAYITSIWIKGTASELHESCNDLPLRIQAVEAAIGVGDYTEHTQDTRRTFGLQQQDLGNHDVMMGKVEWGMAATSTTCIVVGGTGLLIVVGVLLDTLRQIESHLLMRHYEGFTKQGRLRGRRG